MGTPLPWFTAATHSNPAYRFHSVGGRYIVLLFLGSASLPGHHEILNRWFFTRITFSDAALAGFVVTCDRGDLSDPRLNGQIPGLRAFRDFDGAVSRLYGALPDAGLAAGQYRPYWLLADPMMRVIASGNLDSLDQLTKHIDKLPSAETHAGCTLHAPVLLCPRVLEPELCAELIARYRNGESSESGVMRERDGKTVLVLQPDFKMRRDHLIEDDELKAQLRSAIRRRLVPMISRAFQFEVTRMERFIVARYGDGNEGFFQPHRDNTTKGTAHRRFAVTINLNSDEYDGGELRFPEFGSQTYRAPTGGAVVFSCSLLHEATPVQRGERFAFLPFLYDDAAAVIREANNSYLGDGVGSYDRHRA